MRANRCFLLVMLFCCAACKRQEGAGPSARPTAAPDDGWTTFEDAHFRLAARQGHAVRTGPHSAADPTPTFAIFNGPDPARARATGNFIRYDSRSELPPRDAAAFERVLRSIEFKAAKSRRLFMRGVKAQEPGERSVPWGVFHLQLHCIFKL